MENVQLVVADREDRNKICNVGEIGEIYVRAAGLGRSELFLPTPECFWSLYSRDMSCNSTPTRERKC